MILPHYPKSFTVGDGRLEHLFRGPVVVQEKIDGSQIRFGVDANGELWVRSRGALQYPGNTADLFQPALSHLLTVKQFMTPDTTYYGETLCRPKHNTLKYGRVPKGNIVLFDIRRPPNIFSDPVAVCRIARILGLEPVRTIACRVVKDHHAVEAFMSEESQLGGCQLEGLVFKNYAEPHPHDSRESFMVGKYVSEAFKERHDKDWKTRQTEIANLIGGDLANEVRWGKALQKLADAGALTHSVKDIGPAIATLQTDIQLEDKEAIKDALWEHFRRKIERRAVRGFAQWYKDKLLQRQFMAACLPSDEELAS